jgi:hypothetical protein
VTSRSKTARHSDGHERLPDNASCARNVLDGPDNAIQLAERLGGLIYGLLRSEAQHHRS